MAKSPEQPGDIDFDKLDIEQLKDLKNKLDPVLAPDRKVSPLMLVIVRGAVASLEKRIAELENKQV